MPDLKTPPFLCGYTGRHDFACKSVTPDVTSHPMQHALANFRKETEQSREDIARKAKTTRQTVYRIEVGKQTPSLPLVRRLVDASGGLLRADDFMPPAEKAI